MEDIFWHTERWHQDQLSISTAMLDSVSIINKKLAWIILYLSDKAPVSKSLMLIVGCSHAATHVPAFAPLIRKVFSGLKNE